MFGMFTGSRLVVSPEPRDASDSPAQTAPASLLPPWKRHRTESEVAGAHMYELADSKLAPAPEPELGDEEYAGVLPELARRKGG